MIFIAKNEEHEYLVTHDDIVLLGDCHYATEEDLVNCINGKWIFDGYYNGDYEINTEIKTI